MTTKQIEFWAGDFGKEYTERNSSGQDEWDKFYVSTWGYTKIAMNEEFLFGIPKDAKILEVGCNTGMQLLGLQRMSFSNLYGIEVQPYAVERAKDFSKNINIIQGSGFDIPFKDNFFDLVCTNGVLIHISPEDLPKMMDEMYRCTNRYICGFEYYSEQMKTINYRGHDGFLWKADYAKKFIDRFPDLKLVNKKLYPYIAGKENVDCMYLLEKSDQK